MFAMVWAIEHCIFHSTGDFFFIPLLSGFPRQRDYASEKFIASFKVHSAIN